MRMNYDKNRTVWRMEMIIALLWEGADIVPMVVKERK